MRRVSYLQQIGFLCQTNEHWVLGDAGREYVEQGCGDVTSHHV